MDTTLDNSIELLVSPWAVEFYNLIQSTREELMVASPFIGADPLNKIAKILRGNQSQQVLRISIVTNLSVDNLLSGSLDVAALLQLAEFVPGALITYLPRLHAKIYISDAKIAVITSANLTFQGLNLNREYGVLLRDPVLVSKARDDLSKYMALGNQVSLDTLRALTEVTLDLKAIRQRADNSVNAQLKKIFEERTEQAKLELLKARAQGKTTNGIFCDTILYLLEQNGPLRTVELHPLIQEIHPDLCDNAIDRVIGDVHFGKKWKHYVRNAQQALKERGAIRFDGERWFLNR